MDAYRYGEHGVLPPEECVLRDLLDARAAERGDATFVVFEDGSAWSYAELRRRVRVAAKGLADLGVKRGAHVMVWLPNGPECLVTWFAINYLGAVYVPFNTAYRGGVLEHVLRVSDASLGVVHGDLAHRLDGVDLSQLRDVVVLHDMGATVAGLTLHPFSVLEGDSDAAPEPDAPIQPWDASCIIYTSGTTGPSKGVLQSYMQLMTFREGFPLASRDDRHLVNLPLFHAGGTIPVYFMLGHGGSITLVEGFSTDRFWEVVHRTRTTAAILLGVMGGFLMKQPDPPAGYASSLRWVTALPFDADSVAFGKRFEVDVITVFNMTEVSCPLVSELNPTLMGSCGRPRPGVDCRIVDANDCEVPRGTVGELIVRTDRPWAMNHGYYKNPEATAAAWRNGWFHTGDGFRCDEEGNYFFVDRIKDAIRRRGENISSFEVEAEVIAHPAVREAAAVAVKSEISEDEVLVAISLAPGATLDPAELLAFLQPRMAHFMVPRYVRILDELPKTPTSKVQKHLIRDQGVTPDAWDREAAGIRIRRDRLRNA